MFVVACSDVEGFLLKNVVLCMFLQVHGVPVAARGFHVFPLSSHINLSIIIYHLSINSTTVVTLDYYFFLIKMVCEI